MPNSALLLRRLSLAFLSVAVAGMVAAGPARAGFQWVAPSGEAAADPHGAAIVPGPQGPAPAPAAPVTRAPQTLQLPETISGTGAAAQQGSILVPPGQNEKPVRGFANNVPLSVALRQLLPSEYGFSSAADVNLGTLVSWEGGRPWRPILEDMLRAAGLSMKENGKMITIVTASAGSSPKTPFAEKPLSPAPSLQPWDDGKPLSLSPASAPAGSSPSVVVSPDFDEAGAFSGSSPQTSIVDSWTAKRGETLHKVLEKWCRRANIDLNWQAEYDYPLQATVTLTGTFEEAVRSLLLGFEQAQPQPVASLYNNASAGQTVLVVQARGNNYED